jgi:hypothetical protein
MDQKKSRRQREIKTIVYNNAQPIQEEAMAKHRTRYPNGSGRSVTRFPETHTALRSKNGESVFKTITYAELYGMVTRFAAVLVDWASRSVTISASYQNNRKEWLITDLALLHRGDRRSPRVGFNFGGNRLYPWTRGLAPHELRGKREPA